MQKIYVIDTSVLAHDPLAYKSFSNSTVLIPITVIDELDKLKKQPNEVGKNARVATRALEELSEAGEIHKGISIENNILLKIDTSTSAKKFGDDPLYGDNRILACAFEAKKGKTSKSVILVSRDLNLRIRARAFGLLAEGYEKDKLASADDVYMGFRVIESSELGDMLVLKSFIDVEGNKELEEMFPNECVNFITENQDGLVLGRKVGDKIKIINNKTIWGLSPKNKEQAFAIDMLLDPNLPLVTLSGIAGTGKTLCTVAAGMEMVLSKKMYDKMAIYRPMEPVGRDVGFLPGELAEKLSPWFGPIVDSLELLSASKSKKGTNWQDKLSPQFAEKIQFNAMTFIRGRSIPYTYIVLDEAQNTTAEEMRTIISRASSGSKFICIGDITQVDHKDLDAENNGLSYLIEKFKTSHLAGHISFTHGVRSDLAQAAADLL
jgi:PhoH-like ATPase